MHVASLDHRNASSVGGTSARYRSGDLGPRAGIIFGFTGKHVDVLHVLLLGWLASCCNGLAACLDPWPELLAAAYSLNKVLPCLSRRGLRITFTHEATLEDQ
jgi:hypothetical protein